MIIESAVIRFAEKGNTENECSVIECAKLQFAVIHHTMFCGAGAWWLLGIREINRALEIGMLPYGRR
ncbi:MAG: hypothetical protein AAFP90_07920 [Planctomycetota bacterium]